MHMVASQTFCLLEVLPLQVACSIGTFSLNPRQASPLFNGASLPRDARVQFSDRKFYGLRVASLG